MRSAGCMRRFDCRLLSVEPAPNASQLLGAYQLEAKRFFSSEMKRSLQSPEVAFDIGHQWLLLRRQVNQLLFDRRRRPICIRAPNPRFLALLNAYMTTEPGCALGMAQKDRHQATILFRVIAERTPHPIGSEFRIGLAPDIAAVFEACLDGSN